MKCVRIHPIGRRGCNAGRVTQRTCNRKAIIAIVTSSGKILNVCRSCNEKFGKIVGKPYSPLTPSTK